MPPKGPATLAQGRSTTDSEHRIKLLAALAGELAGRGLVEEAVEACRAIVRLRREIDGAHGEPSPASAGEVDPNLTRSAA